MAIIDKRIFLGGGINEDDTIKNISKSDTGYCLNCLRRTNLSGNVGAITNIKGNTLIEVSLPEGNNTVIGSVPDQTSFSIFYFVYNSNNNHCIYRYKTNDNSIELVLQHKALNFNLDYPVTSGNVINEFLSFTDNYNEPRELNYIKALKYTKSKKYRFTDNFFSNGRVGFYLNNITGLSINDKIYIVQNDGYTNQSYEGIATIINMTPLKVITNKSFGLDTKPEGGYIFKYDTNKNTQYYKITDFLLNAIKRPNLEPPTAFYEQDSSKKFNNLRGLLFQFRYRYIYDDNAKSVLSFASKVALPENEQTITGAFNNDISLNNRLRVSFNTGAEEVKAVEVFVRIGNSGNWVLYDTLYKYDTLGNILINSNTNYEYLFYNESRGIAQDQIEVERLFDYVPQKANLQEVIDGNRKIYGNIVEGYDNVDIDVELTLKDEYLPQFVDISQTEDNWFNGAKWAYGYPTWYEISILDEININDVVIIKINLIRADYPKNEVYTINYLITDINKNVIAEDIYNLIKSKISNYFKDYIYIPRVELENIDGIWRITLYRESNSVELLLAKKYKQFKYSYPCFKKGIYQNFGIVYYDKNGRCGAVNTSSDSKIYVPTLQEGFNPDNQSSVFLNYYPYQKIEWEIKNQPPVWASHYAWVKSKPTREFIQWYFDASPTANQLRTDQDGYQRIKINQNIIDFVNKTLDSTIQAYTWKKGDRIKFLYYRYIINHSELYILDYQDWEIIKYDEASLELIVNGINISRYHNDTGILVFAEIYRDIKGVKEDLQYFEMGQLLHIINPHTEKRSHSGTTQNQDIQNNISAKGELEAYDCYVKLRLTTLPQVITFPVEDYNFSDYFSSDVHNYGRSNTIIKDIKQQRLQLIRHSLKYIQNSQVNGFNTFYPLDYETMEEIYGEINGLKLVGDVLKVLQNSKNTSIYILVKELTNADGTTTIVATDKVLGTKRQSVLDYGTSNYNSVIRHNRHLYFYDYKTGEVIRDAANGMETISHREISKMGSYFNKLKTKLQEADRRNILFCYDDENDLLIATFNYIKNNIKYSETLGFSEKENRWISFYSHYKQNENNIEQIENYAYLNNTMLSFLNGQCWVHNANTIYNNFYGKQYDMIVTVYSNEGNDLIKVFDNISLSSNDKNWYSDEIIIPETEINNLGMLSKLYKNHFVEKEQMLYSEFKRNILSKMIINNIEYKLLNGERLRGDVLKIKLVNDNKNLVILYSVIIKSTLSNRNYINQ